MDIGSSSSSGPERPLGLALRDLSRREELGAHLGELQLFILQWSEAHEQMCVREQLEGPIRSAPRESADGRTAIDTPKPSTDVANGGSEIFLSPSSPTLDRIASAVFMNEHDIREATQMLGFSKRTQGRVSRNLGELQRGLDNILPSQGKDLQQKLAKFEKSSFFELLCFAVITTNTVGLTMSTQRNADGAEEWQLLQDLELGCVVFYVFELLIRLSVHQCYFFYRGPVGWNIFDCMLVALAIQEQATRNEANSMSYLRTTRILKVLKVLRIIRLLRFFKELRLIIGGIMASFKTLLWTVLLIAVVTFMFSICFVQGMTGLAHIDMQVDWSNIPNGMVLLFMSSTGGIDWREACDPLWESSTVYYAAFLLYIFVFTFIIQNTITSLFVECLFEKQNSDEAFLISDRLERRDEYSAKIQTLYAYMDTDGDGQVTFKQLCENLHDPRMIAFAGSLEMELTDLRLFFNVLTCGGKNTIDMETFVVGCIKLRGNAKSIDLVDFGRQLTKQAQQIEPLIEEVREMRRTLEKKTLAALSRSFTRAETGVGMSAGNSMVSATAAAESAGKIQRELATESQVEGAQIAMSSLAERFAATSPWGPQLAKRGPQLADGCGTSSSLARLPIACQLEGEDVTLTVDLAAPETSHDGGERLQICPVRVSDNSAYELCAGLVPIAAAVDLHVTGGPAAGVARHPATMTTFARKSGSRRSCAQPGWDLPHGAGGGHPLGSAMRGVSERSPEGADAPTASARAPWSNAPIDTHQK